MLQLLDEASRLQGAKESSFFEQATPPNRLTLARAHEHTPCRVGLGVDWTEPGCTALHCSALDWSGLESSLIDQVKEKNKKSRAYKMPAKKRPSEAFTIKHYAGDVVYSHLIPTLTTTVQCTADCLLITDR